PQGGRFLGAAALAVLGVPAAVAGALGVEGGDDALLCKSLIAVSLDEGSGRAGPPARNGSIIGRPLRGCRARRRRTLRQIKDRP
ncbi:hypothetical protein ABTD78_22540, partial [Acinetobacter baumannii]